jgi:hypothetical protein
MFFLIFFIAIFLDVLNCSLCNPTTTASFPRARHHRYRLHNAHGQPWVRILDTWHPNSQVWFDMAYSGYGRRRPCPGIVGPFLRLFCILKKISDITFLQKLVFVSQNHIHHQRWKFIIMRHVFWTTISIHQSMFVRTTNKTQKLTKIAT